MFSSGKELINQEIMLESFVDYTNALAHITPFSRQKTSFLTFLCEEATEGKLFHIWLLHMVN